MRVSSAEYRCSWGSADRAVLAGYRWTGVTGDRGSCGLGRHRLPPTPRRLLGALQPRGSPGLPDADTRAASHAGMATARAGRVPHRAERVRTGDGEETRMREEAGDAYTTRFASSRAVCELIARPVASSSSASGRREPLVEVERPPGPRSVAVRSAHTYAPASRSGRAAPGRRDRFRIQIDSRRSRLRRGRRPAPPYPFPRPISRRVSWTRRQGRASSGAS